MSVGEEETKGGPRIRRQYRVLKGAGINFVGNVEGRDVFTVNVDVVVCDGFTGNVVLKVDESSNTRITFARSAVSQVLAGDRE